MGDVAKDIFCGWLSGIGQVLTMMPFQNIKIKMVSKSSEYTGYAQAIKKTIAEEGVRSFYKGMLMNLLGVGPQVALQFGTVETLKKYIKRTYEPDKQKLSLPYVTMSGFVAGLPSALVLTPLDHARFRVALNKQNKAEGSMKTAIKIYKQHGFRKLYLGFASTFTRQSNALAVYFTTYELLMRKLNTQSAPVSLTSALLAGGLAGVATWTLTYPLDYIKTLVQTDDLVKPRQTSMLGYLREELSKGSIKRLFIGFEIMIVRAFFVNAAGFFCFEVGKKYVYEQKTQ